MNQDDAWPELDPLLRAIGCSSAQALGRTRRGWLLRAVIQGRAETVLLRVSPVGAAAGAIDALVRELAAPQREADTAELRPLASGCHGGALFASYPDSGFVPASLCLEARRADLDTRLRIAASAAATLARLHDAGVVHGCIDLDTLWLNPESAEVRWTDAAIGSGADADGPLRQLPPAFEPAHEFAAPEMTGRLEATVDVRSDLYCLGGVLYSLLTGRLPFAATDLLELVHSHLAREATPAHELDAAIPRSVSAVLAKLLAKLPASRYQSAHGLRFDLAACQALLRGGVNATEPFEVGARDARGTFALAEALVGREHDLDALLRLCERVERGEAHVVLLRGAAGAGKSALARQALRGAPSAGWTVTAKFDQIASNEPYAFITQAAHEIAQLLLASPQPEIDVWRKRLVESLGANLRLVVDLVPVLGLVVGSQPEVVQMPAAESWHRFRLALQGFVRIFCRPGQPLRLFLDDLQWADQGSLELLGSLVADARLGHLLLIGAYREGAAAPTWAERSALPVHRISLQALDLSHTARLLAQTLQCDGREVLPLARLVQRKTSGNPFHIGQFLRLLHGAQMLRFDYDAGRWNWDVARIQAAGITDDVLALMQRKLDALPAQTSDLLATAALVGGTFELDALARATAQGRRAVRRTLLPAVEAGLVYTRSGGRRAEASGDPAGAEVRFVHDQVQQAACARLPPEEIRRRRLTIGWRLHAMIGQDADRGMAFTAANNLNLAVELIDDPPQLVALAELNLRCGQRAREAAAFAQALDYALAGLAVLDESAWGTHHELQLALHAQAFECAYITGRLAQAEALFAAILANARTKHVKAHAYFTRILVATSLDDSQGAIRFGIEGLRLFGQRLSPFPSRVALLAELARVALRLRGRTPVELERLPAMSDGDARGALRLLMSVCPAAYFQSPNLMSLAALRIVRLSLRHGNAEESPFGYVLLGLIAGALLGRYAQGHAFGQLAMKLARAGRDPVLRVKVMMIFGGFVNFWCESIESSLHLLDESLRLALAVGDVQYANYSILQTLFLSLARGVPLDQVLAECKRREAFTDQTRDEFTIANRRIREQFVRALRGQTSAPASLDDAGFDERAQVERSSAASNRTTLAYLRVVKLQLAYLAGDQVAAHDLAEAAERDRESLLSQIMVAEHTFFRGLILAQRLAQSPRYQGRERRALAHCIARYKRWATHCPANFGSQHLLLKAAWSSLFGTPDEAESLFGQAIVRAAELRQLHVRGIAAELAARHCFAQGRWSDGQGRIDEAITAFSAWGATTKVRALQALSRGAPQAAPRAAAAVTVAQTWRFEELDRLAFDRFVSTSGELGSVGETRELFHSLLRHLIESTGAGAGALLYVAADQALVITAHGRSGPAGIELSTEPPPESSAVVSERVVGYALRSHAPLSVTAPHQDHRFEACPRLARLRPASVLCVPLHGAQEAIGALYLENGALPQAFVLQRMPFLPVLAQQLAMVLQNARAFSALDERTRSLDVANESMAVLRLVQSRLHKFVPRPVREGVAADPRGDELLARDEDVSVIFTDIVGYTALTERVGSRQAQQIVERHFGEFLDAIEQHGGDVNELAGDGMMAVFRDADRSMHARHAVAAAVTIQAMSRRLNEGGSEAIRIKVGVASGAATVGAKRLEGRADSRWTWTATGSVTNLAARLVQAGSGGDVLVSADTARRIGGDGRVCEPLGALLLKGFERPVEVFRIAQPAAPQFRGAQPQPFTDRAAAANPEGGADD
jgi:predicted ATPase/class 3 adenylate cyclase